AEALAVAQVNEGALLRRAGIEGPILVLMGFTPEQASLAVAHDLSPFLGCWEDFAALSQAAQAGGTQGSCHLKIDTGMSRLGVSPGEALELLERVAALPGLKIEGMASHLATSGVPGDPTAREQATVFSSLLAEARRRGHALPASSLEASGGILARPQNAPEPPGLARLGISLYGGLRALESRGVAPLRTAMRFTSRLAAVRLAPAGSGVSYGHLWRAPQDTWLGVVAAGYSDGYPRSASGKAHALIQGRPAPVRGRVCMNAIMVDLTGFDPLPAPGEEVVLLGRSGAEEITADQLGGWADTISYEITCSLGAANRRRHRS
ncbi:MAG: alanine racemase, partial [Proteobacteria bacterium]|nr:alanine racemase [Pseudomonadota bacterium]